MILDCHVHLPSPGLNLTMEWEPCTAGIAAAVDYLQRCSVNGIIASSIRALLAQTPEEVAEGNDEIASASRTYPGFIIPACQVNTNFPDAAITELHRCHEKLGMVWLGELCGYISGYSYTTTAFYDLLQLATELDMVVQIHNDSADDMARLCVDFPQTTFVLPHIGDSPEEVEERIGLAARFPKLYLDISGHGVQRMGVLELAVRQAGRERVLFGSDYTINDPASVIARIQAANFDPEIKNGLLGDNCIHLLREHRWKDSKLKI